MKQSPRNATTEKKLLSLNRDNLSTADFWFLLSEKTVTICKQKVGEPAEAMVKVPKKDFNKFIDWYNKEQTITKLNG